MLYSEIIGQEEAKERLQHMVAESRVPHALLFAEPPGSGTLPAAFAFGTLSSAFRNVSSYPVPCSCQYAECMTGTVRVE